MPNDKRRQDLDADEIAAIREEMEKDSTYIDRFFLLKLHTTLLLCLFSAVMMIFFPSQVTYWLLSTQGSSPDQLDNFLLIRGVFILAYMFAAVLAWHKERYTELVFGSATILAFTNFLLDIPYLVGTEYSAAPFSIAFGILMRIVIIALLVSIFRNLDRANYLQGKLFANPFAPFKL